MQYLVFARGQPHTAANPNTYMKATTTPRRRSIETAKDVKIPSGPLKALAATVYENNVAMNKANKAYKDTREQLHAMMKAEGFQRFDTLAQVKGKPLTLVAEIETPDRTVMDVAKLSKLVPMDTFLTTVSASAKSVEENCGKAVVTQIAVTVPGTENVNVKPLE